MLKEGENVEYEKSKRKYNTQNLIQNQNVSAERRKEIAKKAAKASIEKRRERKKLAEELDIILKSKNYQEKICTALIEKALAGDVRAFEIIRDTVDGRPKQQIESNTSIIKLEDVLNE